MNRHSTGDLSFWGDSWANGTGATNPATTSVPAVVAASCGNRRYLNLGVGANTSTDCKTRLLAAPPYKLFCTTVIWIGINNYDPTPSVVAGDIAAMVAALGHTRYLIVGLAPGEFSFEYSGAAGNTEIVAVNTALASAYGSQFIDIMTPLVAAGAPAGSNPNATDFGHGIVPRGLRSDNRHFNDAGYSLISGLISPVILSNGG